MQISFIGKGFRTKDLVHIIPRLIIAVILAQTLPFKFLGAPESVYIFKLINMEPWGRYLVGTLELISTLFLLTNFYIVGAIISLSIISAANFLHFARLGIEINEDGGTLFVMSIIVVLCSFWLVFYWNSQRTQQVSIHFKVDENDLEEEELP